MYKIGDKVETPLGIGIIKWIDKASHNEDEGYDTMYVSFNGFPEIEINERHIKPYRTAHEKLIEMGLKLKITKNYADGVFSHEWWNDNDDRIIVFYIDEKLTTVYEGNNEIMQIIPQYLEEITND